MQTEFSEKSAALNFKNQINF